MASVPVTQSTETLFVSRDGAARLIGVSTRTIDDAIRTGELEAFRIGRRVVIRRERLISFAERTRREPSEVLGQSASV